MPPETFTDPKVPWKAKALFWLSNQGPATILLILILYGTHVNLPVIMNQLTKAYTANAERLEESAKRYEAANDKVLDALQRDRTLWLEMLRDKRD